MGSDPVGGPILAQSAVVQQLTSLLIDFPWKIQPQDNLLKNSVTGMFYPDPDQLRLMVWPLSADPSSNKALLRGLPEPDENQLTGFMIPVSTTSDDGAWREIWISCVPLTEVARFLDSLGRSLKEGKPLAFSTIAGYRSAISAFHKGFPDGSSVSLNPDISILLTLYHVVGTFLATTLSSLH